MPDVAIETRTFPVSSKTQPEPLIKAQAAAEYLGLNPLAVRRMAVEGRLAAVVYSFGKKKLYRFWMSNLEKFVLANVIHAFSR